MSKTSLGKKPIIRGVSDLFDYEYYCCLCFENLYEENIYKDKTGQKHDVCIDCKNKVSWNE